MSKRYEIDILYRHSIGPLTAKIIPPLPPSNALHSRKSHRCHHQMSSTRENPTAATFKCPPSAKNPTAATIKCPPSAKNPTAATIKCPPLEKIHIEAKFHPQWKDSTDFNGTHEEQSLLSILSCTVKTLLCHEGQLITWA